MGGGGGKEDKKAKGQDLKQIAAARKAQLRAQREAARSVARAEQRAAQEAKILKRAFGGGEGLVNFGDAGTVEARATLRVPVTDAFLMRWGGLGGGASTEGAPFGLGRQYLRSAHPNVREKHDLNKLYVDSIERFACRLHGKAKELVMICAKRSSSVALSGENESGLTPLVNQQLSPQAQASIQVVLDGNNALIQQTN